MVESSDRELGIIRVADKAFQVWDRETMSVDMDKADKLSHFRSAGRYKCPCSRPLVDQRPRTKSPGSL